MLGAVSLSSGSTGYYRTSQRTLLLVRISKATNRPRTYLDVSGQLEKTMFNKFRLAQSLRALLINAASYLPSALDALVRQYEKFFNVDIRGTYLQDNTADDEDDREDEETLVAHPWKDGKRVSPSKNLYKHLKLAGLHVPADPSACIIVQKEIRKSGQVFQASSSQGNSQIVFIDDSNSVNGAGMFREIFALIPDPEEEPELLLLVDQFQPLSTADEEFDYARSFRDWGARLHYRESRTTLIPASRIICHFASSVQTVSGILKESVLVLPLRHA